MPTATPDPDPQTEASALLSSIVHRRSQTLVSLDHHRWRKIRVSKATTRGKTGIVAHLLFLFCCDLLPLMLLRPPLHPRVVACVSDRRTHWLTHKRSAHGKQTTTSMQTSWVEGQSAGALVACVSSMSRRTMPRQSLARHVARRRDRSATQTRWRGPRHHRSATQPAPEHRQQCRRRGFVLSIFVSVFLI